MLSALSLVPRPRELTLGSGSFSLSRDTVIIANTALADDAIRWFQETLYRQTGMLIGTLLGTGGNTIRLQLDAALTPESYALRISAEGIQVKASDANGFLYALVTVLQTIPLHQPSGALQWRLPELEIHDSPRFAWRGLMLDSVRHFQPVWWVKKFIDVMALHKLNNLHWHLTDDQGWRVEIKKHPALTALGAWRKESRTGHERTGGEADFDGRPHGGFYSQDDLREIVAHAQSRGITIVPEIEMPGHATAVLAAYPELSCTGGQFEVSPRWGIFDDVFCAGNDQVFQVLEDVLEEVLDIFPSRFIHVGGDECHKTRWKACPKCQQRIKDENLADENELQSWFVRHFDRFLTERGRRLIGWDEILEGGLAQNAAVMSWRGEEGGIAAAQAGHDVVMAPHKQTYLDYYQSEDQGSEPLSIGGYLPLEKAYQFEPVPAALTDDQSSHVLGGQGQLWTEYMPHADHVEYMAYPRACALAEALWSQKSDRNFGDFSARLRGHLRLLDRFGVNYRPL